MLLNLGNGVFINTERIVSIEIIEPLVHEQYGFVPDGYNLIFITDIINDRESIECSCDNSKCSCDNSECPGFIKDSYNYLYYIHPKSFTSREEAELWLFRNLSDRIINDKTEMH